MKLKDFTFTSATIIYTGGGKWIITVGPRSHAHVLNTILKQIQGQNAPSFQVFSASGETVSESHEADIVIQGLECQPKQFHMFF